MLKPNSVIGDRFEVERINKDNLIYRNNNRQLTLQVEPGFEPQKYLAIFLSLAEKWDDPDNSIVTQEDLELIRKNITVAYLLMGSIVVFE